MNTPLFTVCNHFPILPTPVPCFPMLQKYFSYALLPNGSIIDEIVLIWWLLSFCVWKASLKSKAYYNSHTGCTPKKIRVVVCYNIFKVRSGVLFQDQN